LNSASTLSWLKENSEIKIFRFIQAVILLALFLFGTGFDGNTAALYFANARMNALSLEKRDMALNGSIESRAREVVETEVLGPMERGRVPLFPRLSSVQTVMKRGGKLYISVNVPDLADTQVSYTLVNAAMKKAIAKNLSFAGQVVFFVNGEMVQH